MTTAVLPEAAPAVRAYQYRTPRVASGAFFLLVGAAFLLDSLGLFRFTFAVFWPLLAVSVAVSLLLNRARRLVVEEDRSAQLAVAEERVRIARELHDIVAHGVSLMTIQIAGARRVAPKDPASAEEALLAAEQAGRQTLTDLQGMLAALRGADASIGAAAAPQRGPWTAEAGARSDEPRSPLPKLSDLPVLVDAVRHTGRQVTFQVLGDPPFVPARVEVTVYRVVQEALTNAVRHAGEAPIDVQVIFSPAAITVFVDDEGPSLHPHTSTSGSGHGLLGMQERLAAVGGNLEAGPRRPGPGWRVYASIPLVALPEEAPPV